MALKDTLKKGKIDYSKMTAKEIEAQNKPEASGRGGFKRF